MPPLLYDALGRAVEPSRLTTEESGPTLTGVRNIWSDHPSRGLTPGRLTSILLEAETVDPMRYFELAEDMEEKDLHYLGVLNQRKLAVSQLELTVEAASDDKTDVAIADELRAWLRRDTLQMELYDLLDAIGKGVCCAEILWETSAKQWRPGQIKRRDPKWFMFDRVDGETLLRREGAELVPLTPFKYVVHIAKAKSGLPIRGGLARAVSWVWLFKNFSLKDWVSFSEVFGQPYRLGKYDPSATPEDKDALMRALASLGADAAAIIPKSMVIELVENAGKSGSIDMYDRLQRFLDEQISKGVLGQTLTTEVTQGGGNRALGEVHAGVAKNIQDADAIALQATLNRDLARPFVDLNYGPRDAYPRLLIGQTDQLTLKERLDYTLKFVDKGLKVEKSQVADKLGWQEPKADAELLTPSATGAPSPSADDVPPLRAVASQRVAVNAAENAAEIPAGKDAIDVAVSDLLADEGWRPVIEDVLAPIDALLGSASSLEEVRERLAAAVGDMDTTALAALLESAGFTTRLAGALSVPLSAQQT